MKIIRQKFSVKGMSCAACERAVDRAVRELPFVKNVTVSLLLNTMLVEFDSENGNIKEIEDAVKNAGYEASALIESITEPKQNSESENLLFRLLSSIILLIPLMYLSMGFNMFGARLPDVLENNHFYIAIIQMLLALVVLLINKKFFVSGFRALMHGSANMDTLVMLSTSAAFLYSVYITFFKLNLHELYYETSAMIPTLITIGKLLESFSKGKTTNAIKSLMDLSAKTAHKIIGKEEREVDVNSLNIGDVIKIYSGETIPADSKIIEGSAFIDESMLNGESMPVAKNAGETVYQGSINKNGFLICKVIRLAKDSTLSKVIEMVENVNQTKAPIAKIADKVASVFVPAVILISIITFIIWLIYFKLNPNSDIFYDTALTFALERAISVLVIACPCALGLATPTAIMVGSGVGAKNGILYKNAQSIETAGKVNIAAFDKTGTLTNAKMHITDVVTYLNTEKDVLLNLASAIESKSTHPISNAFKNIKYSHNVENIKEIAGEGLSGKIKGEEILAGNEKILLAHNIQKDNKINEDIKKLTSEGKTIIIICLNKKILGLIALSDTIKPFAKDTIEKINGLNIETVIITGDNERAANYVSSLVGIKEVISCVLPNEKANEIYKLKQKNINGKNAVVIMVGDGINDAVSLKAADVGLAIGKAKDIAIESSDIVLTNANIMSVYNAIYLSKKVLKNIKENLFFAFFYNTICIPIAAGALIFVGIKINPMIGAFAMACSSVSVVLNALRLNLIKFEKSDNYDNYEKEGQFIMKKTFNVRGMMCEHCVKHVKNALEKIDGVVNVNVNLQDKTAIVEYTKNIEDLVFIDAIKEAGYETVV